jgi:molecular chaperone GrpE
MTDNDTRPLDPEAEAELAGVPEDLIDRTRTTRRCARELARRPRGRAAGRALRQGGDPERPPASGKDITDARNYAATGFARDMLSVSDNLSRALDALPQELREDEKLKSFVAGIEATRRELDKVFTQNGITRIAALGLPLDPHQHQAMLEVPSADAEPGTIVQELQSGFMIKDRLLRPAMVAVAKKGE